ncbi:MAG: hypothetical protein LBG64_03810 [Pseudomonadales bacterium]|nr:hypothetical protein [Pseudomonadales bacterium]
MQNTVKKLLPFVLPIIALVLVVMVVARWYSDRTEESMNIPELTEGLEIENLSETELTALENMRRGVGNFQTVAMTGVHTGEIRYEVQGDSVVVSVIANLPEGTLGQRYVLWSRDAENNFVQISELQFLKGGFSAGLVVSIDRLPLTFIVSEDGLNAIAPENELLIGTIESQD